MDQNNYQQPVQQPAAAQPSILPFGIVSLVLAFTAYGGIVGLILAIIGRKKGKEYIAQGGTLEGQAKTGFGLCKAGLILGIIGVVVAVIITIVAIATRAALNNLASQFNY
ncbi:MAG: hypothetical protein IKI03_09780 [Clostridia bacterium]|nr:hypothetical protein [Clostridia bacterium]